MMVSTIFESFNVLFDELDGIPQRLGSCNETANGMKNTTAAKAVLIMVDCPFNDLANHHFIPVLGCSSRTSKAFYIFYDCFDGIPVRTLSTLSPIFFSIRLKMLSSVMPNTCRAKKIPLPSVFRHLDTLGDGAKQPLLLLFK